MHHSHSGKGTVAYADLPDYMQSKHFFRRTLMNTNPIVGSNCNYMLFNEGDIDPVLNKKIVYLVLKTEDCIVYLDEALEVEWSVQNAKLDEHQGDVLNKVAELESRSRFIADKELLSSIRRQVAEGLARYLDGLSLPHANQIFALAEKEIEARNRETSWRWYFSAAWKVMISCVMLVLVFWLCRDVVVRMFGVKGFHVILGSCCGSIGAIISIISRGNKLDLDANAGKLIHETEGLARIATGIAGAAVTALAIKGGIMLSGTKFGGSKLAVLLAFCIAAGASERMVPNLIKKVEGHKGA